MNADPRRKLNTNEKQLGIFISYMGKGKAFGDCFVVVWFWFCWGFFNVIDRDNCKVSLSGFIQKMEIHVSKDYRDIQLEKLT